MSSLRQPYQLYDKLNNQSQKIRLLAIEQSSDRHFDNSMLCTAISTWWRSTLLCLVICIGDPIFTKRAVIKGCDLPLTVNLAAALRRLRASYSNYLAECAFDWILFWSPGGLFKLRPRPSSVYGTSKRYSSGLMLSLSSNIDPQDPLASGFQALKSLR